MKNIIIGTAGHIDHGKQRLSGVSPEEIQIDGKRAAEEEFHPIFIWRFTHFDLP